MKKQLIIQRMVAVLLVCIHIISITPVTFYHDLLSNHTDENIQHSHSDKTEISTSGIDCHADGFVADKSYTFAYTALALKCPVVQGSYIQNPAPGFYTQHHFYAELRGPPSTI